MAILGGVIDGRQMLEMSLGDLLVWPLGPPRVRITLGVGNQARDQLRAAIYAAGSHYTTVEVLPFEVVLVGSGNTTGMFSGCASLTSVPDMDTASATNMTYMFDGCAELYDGAVRLLRDTMPPNSATTRMIGGLSGSTGMTRLPFYNYDGTPLN